MRLSGGSSILAPGVADAGDGDDDPRRGRVALDLLPQVGDGHVDGPGPQVAPRAPDDLEQLRAADRALRCWYSRRRMATSRAVRETGSPVADARQRPRSIRQPSVSIVCGGVRARLRRASALTRASSSRVRTAS